jgi:vacuolar-type H+-ATPase subunit H
MWYNYNVYVFAFYKEANFDKTTHKYGGMNLSKEIILKIKEIEAQAQKIRSDAAEEAAARVKRAEIDGKKLCEKAEADAAKVNREKLAITAERADDLVSRAKENVQKEAEALRESAEFNLREAVRLIVAGVYEQCQ